jgi:hypothetical protein
MEWVDEACGGFFAKEQAGTQMYGRAKPDLIRKRVLLAD